MTVIEMTPDPPDQKVSRQPEGGGARTSSLTWAPIALFIYKRPEHTERMITSLQNCDGFAESQVYVFADGPKQARDLPGVLEARAVARRLLGDHSAYVERETNQGIEDSIISGVTQLCDQHGTVVVIEEDLVLSPHFLTFLNTGLRRYAGEPRVMQIGGYMFDVPQFRQRTEAIFLPMTSSLGWATWKRAWDQFDPAATGWRERLRDAHERNRFDLDGHFRYAKMLSHHMGSRAPAWDIRWYYTVFAKGGLSLYPPRTLVLHTGFDGSGTHDRFSLPVHQAEIETAAIFAMPISVSESPDKGLVFEAIEKRRPSSTLRKATALARFAFRRVREKVAAL